LGTVGLDELTLRCAACGRDHGLGELAWRCADCGGVLDLAGFSPVVPRLSVLGRRRPTLWRYAEALPIEEPVDVSLGEGMTPLVTAPADPGLMLKIDYLMPSGSFKDRGAVLLAALARRLDVPRMVADSSGNAGSAVAAYAARAQIACEVYVPAATSAGKVAQLRAYGATVRQIPGSREDTADAAAEAADQPGTFYASHVYHPFFLQGTKTYVFELWEQLGGVLPATLVLPVGNGTLVLGAYLGCRDLLDQGLIDRLPVIVAVQAAGCAPLARAFVGGAAEPAAIVGQPTIAEGIAIARPARGAQILAAVRDTGGAIVTVTDDEVSAAHVDLARSGLYVEPTAAACFAALRVGLIDAGPGPDGRPGAVAPLCGSGLKAKPPEVAGVLFSHPGHDDHARDQTDHKCEPESRESDISAAGREHHRRSHWISLTVAAVYVRQLAGGRVPDHPGPRRWAARRTYSLVTIQLTLLYGRPFRLFAGGYKPISAVCKRVAACW